ncbi:hypothetical protein [Williamsoniiplasma lucivorax]|uniref:Uncharacterized protein n=1 Tax=Williamsoniiplasma lucivorax TaxID=209274 RepID=A0A2S5RCS9_9MOLU|nr:hypothetical protein [Williamsoniiplasma lucivorax]PPE05136.1 hypothetical protein ELUCI_v1c06720 [Williamsoniiplasma lucivorax]
MKKTVVIFIIFISLVAGAFAFSLKANANHQNKIPATATQQKD